MAGITNNRYYVPIDLLPDAFAYHRIITDDQGKPLDYVFLDVNPAFEKMTGLKKENVIGKAVTEVLPSIKSSQYDWINAYGRVALGEESLHFEQYSEPLGRWYKVTAYSDNPGYFGTIFQDVTEKKETEKSLIENREKYRTIFDQSLVGLYLHDLQGNIIDVNQMGCQQLGYSRVELLELTVFDLHPKSIDTVNLPRKEILNLWAKWDEGQRMTIEAEHQRKDGTILPVQISTGKMRYENKTLMLAIVQDITERKLAEEELEKLNRELEQRVRSRTSELEQVNKELNAFTYSVSHDLRSPLRRINGFSQMLLEEYADQLDYQGKDYLKRIATSAVGMNELIEDLLKLSRVSRHELEWEPVELSVLVRIYLEQLIEKEPGRKVEVVIAPGIAACGDTALLRIAIGNLLDNAWKYTAECEEARIEFGSLDQEGCQVYYISDNGAGFNMKHAGKLFTPFQRLHSTSSYSGTGIGLSIVSRIITRHGGEIWGEGEPGKGATFYFTLPYA